jgi:hypothetical protein
MSGRWDSRQSKLKFWIGVVTDRFSKKMSLMLFLFFVTLSIFQLYKLRYTQEDTSLFYLIFDVVCSFFFFTAYKIKKTGITSWK